MTKSNLGNIPPITKYSYFNYRENDDVEFKFDFAAQPAFFLFLHHFSLDGLNTKKCARRRRVFLPTPDLKKKLHSLNLVPRVYSAFKMAAEGGEDPALYRYNTHADWCEDIDILTLFVIDRNCVPCKMADLCSYICYFLCN